MKKFFTVFFLLAAPLGLFAENKIQMVTFFPVPYVAYSKVNVGTQFDIGAGRLCNLNLGCAESGELGTKPLNVTEYASLQSGTLNLQTAKAVRSQELRLGLGGGATAVDFRSDLRLIKLDKGYSMEANTMNLYSLKLFPDYINNAFPSCAATGAEGAPQISWQKLQLKDKEEVFLVCGTPKDAPGCTDADYKASHKSECCPGVSTSDNVCYQDCNCTTKAETAGSPNKLRDESAMCGRLNVNCEWIYQSSYQTESECLQQMGSSLSVGSFGSCTWATPIYVSGSNATCLTSGGSCLVGPGGGSAPTYSVYSQAYTVKNSCSRCKNGW